MCFTCLFLINTGSYSLLSLVYWWLICFVDCSAWFSSLSSNSTGLALYFYFSCFLLIDNLFLLVLTVYIIGSLMISFPCCVISFRLLSGVCGWFLTRYYHWFSLVSLTIDCLCLFVLFGYYLFTYLIELILFVDLTVSSWLISFADSYSSLIDWFVWFCTI